MARRNFQANGGRPERRRLDMTRLVKVVRSSTYQGYLPIETVAAGKTGPVDPHRDVPALLEKLRAAIKETA